ncbi:hypothetical protein R5H32_04985 [Defluviimonas sp. D31]|uniref:hypothetical protein n=1 Tax=Defluviimonas sp. D31 TaxID=3083253 RepID=UPI00296F60BC|nr:hypothetical protein [Defluviimonas sp. D31]MDW4548702.1 hypothetical protein [Defluviimonas sp. D31]
MATGSCAPTWGLRPVSWARKYFQGAHLRPSGNAPEFRCYAEAENQEAADHLLGTTLDATRRAFG